MSHILKKSIEVMKYKTVDGRPVMTLGRIQIQTHKRSEPRDIYAISSPNPNKGLDAQIRLDAKFCELDDQGVRIPTRITEVEEITEEELGRFYHCICRIKQILNQDFEAESSPLSPYDSSSEGSFSSSIRQRLCKFLPSFKSPNKVMVDNDIQQLLDEVKGVNKQRDILTLIDFVAKYYTDLIDQKVENGDIFMRVERLAKTLDQGVEIWEGVGRHLTLNTPRGAKRANYNLSNIIDSANHYCEQSSISFEEVVEALLEGDVDNFSLTTKS